ncbi:hypothetical protein ACIHFD_18350 [Nonomuraea sp. NPDC051941]|uniref:hypothetical protein n=1 Tax=Nonomuraea sp. NPDC051941 TaxID=3364373 RepID=UPI0037C8C38E
MVAAVFEFDWTVCYPRLVSDGTLFDAMRVATALGTPDRDSATVVAGWVACLVGSTFDGFLGRVWTGRLVRYNSAFDGWSADDLSCSRGSAWP